MRRWVLFAAVAVVPLCGCAMCASPYDYCGPVVDRQPGLARHESWHGEPTEAYEVFDGAVVMESTGTMPTASPRSVRQARAAAPSPWEQQRR